MKSKRCAEQAQIGKSTDYSMCVCLYTNTRTHVHTHTYIHIDSGSIVGISILIHIHKHMHIHIHIHIHISRDMCVSSGYLYTHTYTIYIYIYIYQEICVFLVCCQCKTSSQLLPRRSYGMHVSSFSYDMYPPPHMTASASTISPRRSFHLRTTRTCRLVFQCVPSVFLVCS